MICPQFSGHRFKIESLTFHHGCFPEFYGRHPFCFRLDSALESTQTDLFYGIAAASPSVWFPGWMEFEQRHPMQAQRVYLSLGDKEEHTKNAVMAAVGDNIRTLHSRLIARGADCTLEWNSGGHFKDADLRTAKAFRWVMEDM